MLSTKIAIDNRENKFKSFSETFPYCAFALAIALIYPNRANYRQRAFLFSFVVGFNSVMLFWFLAYLAKCAYTLDMYNLSRNISIGILVAVFFFKYFYVSYKNDKFAELLKKITDDLLKGNNMDEDYQAIYEHYIKLGKLGQTCWIIIPILLSSQFPIYAGVCMIHESLKSDVGKRYMVHEMELKFIEDKQYDTPYFEVMFAYNLVQCVVLSPNYAGMDGSFCIATSHLCLKLKLMAHKVRRAFRDSNNRDELEKSMKEAIKDHQEILTFYDDLQDVYGGWLFTVFLLTSGMISMSLYQIYLNDHFDSKYTIFALSGVIHMFAPCYFACNLMKVSEELSWDLYDAAWETWADPVITKLLIFMIAKSQQTLILSGKGIVYFNMQLFISVLQTSYSFFTLISRITQDAKNLPAESATLPTTWTDHPGEVVVMTGMFRFHFSAGAIWKEISTLYLVRSGGFQPWFANILRTATKASVPVRNRVDTPIRDNICIPSKLIRLHLRLHHPY